MKVKYLIIYFFNKIFNLILFILLSVLKKILYDHDFVSF